MMRTTTKTQREDAAATLVNLLTQAITHEIRMNEQDATSLAQRIADGLFRIACGENLYIPKLDRRRRNAAIRNEFNGRNGHELCARYGISKSQLYRILAEGGSERVF